MTAPTHQLAALTAAAGLLVLYPREAGTGLAVTAIIAVMIGALTPDLDQPAANLGGRLLGAGLVGKIFGRFSGGHRHFTHSVLGAFIIAYGLAWLMGHLLSPAIANEARLVWAAFMAGYLSHILADTFTDRGVPWLWPFPWHFRLPPGPNALRITTGSFVEMLFLRGALVVALAVLLRTNWEIFAAFWR